MGLYTNNTQMYRLVLLIDAPVVFVCYSEETSLQSCCFYYGLFDVDMSTLCEQLTRQAVLTVLQYQ